MYEENENKIEWTPILKKVGIVVVVLLVIFGIITLVNRCTKNKDDDKTNKPSEISLEKQLDELEAATLQYLTTDNLPTEINASKTIRLKILINRNLTEGITDSEKNQCDTSESYSEVTRLENNYAVKMNLVCGKNKTSRVIYVGCFENCNGGLCKGEETQIGGVCGGDNTPTTPVDGDNSNTNNGVVQPNIKNPSSQTNNNSSGTVKPNNSGSSNTSTPSTGNSNSNSTISNNVTLKQYEFKRCENKPVVCNRGTLNTSTGYCEFYADSLEYGVVTQTGVKQQSSTYQEKANVPKTTTTEVTLLPSQAKNSGNVTYRFKSMAKDGKITYYKTVTTYGCRGNVKPVNGMCTYTTTTDVPVYGCEDITFVYNASNNTCTKWVNKLDHAVPGDAPVCQTIWSYSTSLPGWTRTGNVK